MAEEDPAWPDKAMFAALLLIVGGVLGLGVEGLRSVATVEDKLPPGLLQAYPHWLSAVMAAATVVLGIACLRTQAAVYGYAGILTGLGSLAYAGLVPFLSLLALVMLIKSKMEGEETRNDGVKLNTGLWPDKAMAASLFMVVGAAVALVQAVAIARGDYEPILLPETAGLVVDFAVAGFLLVASRQVYHLRRSWLGELGAAASILSFGLYVLGPAIGVTILVFMLLARKEDEFAPQPTVLSFKAKGEATAEKPAKTGKAKAVKR